VAWDEQELALWQEIYLAESKLSQFSGVGIDGGRKNSDHCPHSEVKGEDRN
jgi:hypothetical protein